MSSLVLPGATIGVLGSGQLGRMFAIAARRMGYRVHVLSPDDDTPAGQVADVEIRAAYDDLDAVANFARGVQAVTFEFENVPVAAAEVAARFAPVRPAGEVLHVTQNRLREKNFLRQAGLPVTPFVEIRSLPALQTILATWRLPAVLKSAAWGYDGKGQFRLDSPHQAQAAWEAIGSGPAILEQWVDYHSELSVVAARDQAGTIACYAPVCNQHAHHILDLSWSPGEMPAALADAAQEMARTVLAKLNVVGVLCVEFFRTTDEQLLINELAPRPHNSGHLTIDAHETDQFEQQVRAVCGFGLGSTRQLRAAAMANLLGDLWEHGTPEWFAACRDPRVKLHLYGKQAPRPGRKMGHLTALGETAADASAAVLAARGRLVVPRQR